MATRIGVMSENVDGRTAVMTWTGLTQASTDVGDGANLNRFPERTVQVTGTFGVAGEVRLEGSNDGGANWGRLHDAWGALMTIISTIPVAIGDNPILIRPMVQAGDGTTNLTVTIAATKRGY